MDPAFELYAVLGLIPAGIYLSGLYGDASLFLSRTPLGTMKEGPDPERARKYWHGLSTPYDKTIELDLA